MKRRDFLALGAGGIAAGLSLGPASAAEPAVGLIERFYVALKAVMQRTGNGSVAARAQGLAGPVNSTFDIPGMARLAIGSHLSNVGGQQGAITQAFGKFLVASYAKQFGAYGGERFDVLPQTEKRRIGTLVRTKIIDAGGRSTDVDYIVGSSGRSIDIYLNSSVSELASRRAEFDSLLSSGGATALLSSLRERTDRLLAS
jgi:phospholipid transport system substrate-binding protein